MTNNLYVDINHVNNVIARTDALWAEANDLKYRFKSPGSVKWKRVGPLSVGTSVQDFKIESFALKNSSKWEGIGSGVIKYTYDFQTNFTVTPVVCATYDGTLNGVTVAIDLKTNVGGAKSATDRLEVRLKRPNATKWKAADQFYVHIIAMGV